MGDDGNDCHSFLTFLLEPVIPNGIYTVLFNRVPFVLFGIRIAFTLSPHLMQNLVCVQAHPYYLSHPQSWHVDKSTKILNIL